MQLKDSRGALFLPPSDAYVRSFIYLFYTLIKRYHTKALSNQASSFEFLSSGGQESWHLSGFSNNLSSWGLVWDLNLGPLMPEARTITCRPKQPFKGKLEHLLHFWGSTRCFRRLIFHFFSLLLLRITSLMYILFMWTIL